MNHEADYKPNEVKWGDNIPTYKPLLNNKIFTFEIDKRYWCFTPNINLNFHAGELELVFLCVGVYIRLW